VEVFAAYGSLAVTLSLVVARPRVRHDHRIGPAPAAAVGAILMLATRVVSWRDAADAAVLLARPLAGIVALMVMAASAERVGLLEAIASRHLARVRGGTTGLFAGVFALSFATASVLNNDSAILLLTPAVIALVRRRWPGEPRIVAPFAFAVFMAAGVAPLVLSNPMNMIVAAYAGIGFNAYARAMIPVAVAGSLAALGVLLLVFGRALRAAPPALVPADAGDLRPVQRKLLAVLAGVLLACPFVAYAGGAVGAVAVAGAIAAAWLAGRDARVSPLRVATDGVAWDILVFLALVNVLGAGLRNVGFVASLSALYGRCGVAGVGVVSALGSAILNNHPMAILNMLALDAVRGATPRHVLAALVGGDIGPRLLPVGSLAGLLWVDLLRRHRVDVPLARFVAVGAAVAAPTLAVSLWVLGLQ
jgi:arsenical pump membrane protein